MAVVEGGHLPVCIRFTLLSVSVHACMLETL